MRTGDCSVVVVAHGREVPEQADGVVVLGFGDEYTLRFRSHNGRRGVADVWIDGVKITDGGLIVPAYGSVDLETPPATPGRRFRFASTESDAARAAGKGGPDSDGTKGLIRVDYRSERYRPPAVYPRSSYPIPMNPDPYRFTNYSGGDQPVHLSSFSDKSIPSDMIASAAPSAAPAPSLETLSAGVTVEGSTSAQTFREEHVDLESSVTTLLLKLKGRVQEHPAYASPFPPPPSGGARYCPGCGTKVTALSHNCLGCGRRIR